MTSTTPEKRASSVHMGSPKPPAFARHTGTPPPRRLDNSASVRKLAPLVLPSSPAPRPTERLDEIREACAELVEREDVSKQSALQIMRLFHDLETLLQKECVERDKVITNLGFELERARSPSHAPCTVEAQGAPRDTGAPVSKPAVRRKSRW